MSDIDAAREDGIPSPLAAYEEAYASDGYVLVAGLISPEQASVLFQECLRGVRGEIPVPTWREHTARSSPHGDVSPPSPRGEAQFMQLAHPSQCPDLGHWRDHPCYRRAFALARALCPGDGMFFSYDQCFYKPGGSMAVVYPHQDGAYWGTVGITCWVALTEVTPEMAPVQYYPGSHRRLLPHVPAPKAWNEMKDYTVEPHALDELSIEPRSFALRPGDCVFHSSLTVHGSGPNRGRTARCGLALHYETRNRLC